MVAPVKLNFKIYQGSTFKEVLRWETSTKVYKSITAITKAAPMVVTSASHGIPVGWRTKITNVVGMKEVNSADTYHTVTATSANSVTINALNSLSYTDYTSGGVLEYNEPRSLAGVTGRMQLRAKADSATILLELTTANGGVVIDDVLKTITLNISAADTSALTFTSAVYSLELVEGTEVTPFIFGGITVDKEITR
jgi:hypothetical protein